MPAGLIRASAEAAELEQTLGNDYVYHMCGWRIYPTLDAAKILARHAPPDGGPARFNDTTADADGNVYAVQPGDSKMYRHELERFGGKAAVLADEFERWFSGLWKGKRLAGTVAVISLLVALGFFNAARCSERAEGEGAVYLGSSQKKTAISGFFYGRFPGR